MTAHTLFIDVPWAMLLKSGVVQKTATDDVRVSVKERFFSDSMRPYLLEIVVDEEWYLANYPDVRVAVEQHLITSASEHYVRFGYFGHRMPYEIQVDTNWYLSQNPDVKDALDRGGAASAQSHFVSVGYPEGRRPFADFRLKRGRQVSKSPTVNPNVPRNPAGASKIDVPPVTDSTASHAASDASSLEDSLAPKSDISENGLSKKNVDRVQSEVRELLIRALGTSYVSISSVDGYKTGNNYQSVQFEDGLSSSGYRRDRSKLFAAFDFSGQSILDCGSNLGELSRLARNRGASFVDGYEYEAFFVKLAQLINAYQGTNRVSFFHRDLSNRGIYQRDYDVALAFSVYPYISPVLDTLSAKISRALVLETHDLIDLSARYIEPISNLFPHYSLIGFTDYGHGAGKRAVYAFTKSRDDLLPQGGLLKPGVSLIDARLGFIDDNVFSELTQAGTSPSLADMDAFGSKHVGAFEDDLAKFTAGKRYWFEMIRGYVEYKKIGIVNNENCFVRAVTESLRLSHADSSLQVELSSPDAVKQRVRLRYLDVDCLQRDAANIQPIVLKNSSLDAGLYRFRLLHSEDTIYCDDLDGFHRLFWAKILRVKSLPALIEFLT